MENVLSERKNNSAMRYMFATLHDGSPECEPDFIGVWLNYERLIQWEQHVFVAGSFLCFPIVL